MRALRTAGEMTASASMGLGPFAVMLIMLGLNPEFISTSVQPTPEMMATFQTPTPTVYLGTPAAGLGAPEFEPLELPPEPPQRPVTRSPVTPSTPVDIDPVEDTDSSTEVADSVQQTESLNDGTGIVDAGNDEVGQIGEGTPDGSPDLVGGSSAGRGNGARTFTLRRGSSSGTRTDCIENSEAVVDLGRNRYSVERDLIDYYAEDLAEAGKLARVGWYREQGDVVGFKIRRITCGNVLHQAGFRNGDVITSINGSTITNVAGALMAYRQLRSRRSLAVRVQRQDGSSVALKFRLT